MSAALKVFITGASSGIGLALADEYARRGAILGLVARRGEALAAFQQSHPHTTISIYAVDVRDADALAAAAARFIAEHGVPDVVIANAGISQGAVTGQGDLHSFRDVMDINYFGMVATFEPFAAAMVAARQDTARDTKRGTAGGRTGGTLVGIASVAGVRGLPGSGAYSASKSAALKYLEALRVEMRPLGVGVVTIAPGYIRTPMTAHNPYAMPFLMDADRFAAKVARAVERQTAFAVFPWQMRIVAILLHVLPRWLYDRAFERAPRKPRVVAE